jgi:hypothetical protein
MMIERARRLCPSLQVLSPHLSRVSSANLSLLSVVMRYAPVSELSPGVVADCAGGSNCLPDRDCIA